MSKSPKVLIVGAGIGGLTAALELAHQGLDVTVLEKASTPGGKIRQIKVGGAFIDSGPTVFTMRWIFEQIFNDCHENFDSELDRKSTRLNSSH